METVTGQLIRLEAIKAAARVASQYDGVANLLIHAGWVSTFIEEGKSPSCNSTTPIHYKCSCTSDTGQSP
jgi:hypothetical protein